MTTEPNTDQNMRLPEGKTCADCKFINHCIVLINCDPKNTSCDWAPSRFKPSALVPRILRFLESSLAGNDPQRVVKEPHRFGGAHVELCELIIELRKAENESGEELLTKFESLCYDRKVDYALRAKLLSRLGSATYVSQMPVGRISPYCEQCESEFACNCEESENERGQL